MGWCPDAPAMRTTPTTHKILPVTLHPSEPDGGAGGPRRIDGKQYHSKKITNKSLFPICFFTSGNSLIFEDSLW
jgi:hypothetical protein